MYTQYFGLTEKPFTIAPDPHFLYLSELHREALAHLLYGIESGGCLVLLTGEVGTGKTTVSRCLVEQLPEATDIALILNPKLTVVELLSTICDELQIQSAAPHASVKYYIDILNSHLLDSHARGRNTVLIIDEAQDLDPDILEQLRLLTNLETNTEKLLKIILLGQPELRDLLDKPEFSQVNQRITSRYHLLPLQEQDVFSYIDHRIRVAGGGRDRLFSDKAVKRISQLSKGVPRLINLFCDRALLGAYVGEKDRVDPDIVDKAAREVLGSGKKPEKPPGLSFSPIRLQPVLLISLILALILTGTVLIFFSPKPADLSPQGQATTYKTKTDNVSKTIPAKVENPEKPAQTMKEDSTDQRTPRIVNKSHENGKNK